MPEGTVVGVIGSNGAGKSTILRAISGSTPISGGEVRFVGRRIDGMATHYLVRFGIVHVPENRHLFPYMTVVASLEIGA
ncbi:MAG: ATP-binding cassette domain-containing protein [Syntrophorhabdales bacterium]